MRICLLLPGFLPAIGGLEKAADCLATVLASWGHEPVVLTQVPRGSAEVIQRSYPIRTYPRPLSTTWLPRTPAKALQQMHGRYQFDLIWAFQAYPTGYAAVRTGRRLGLPVVISSRGGDLSQRSRYLARWLPGKRIVWALKHAQAVTVLNEHLVQRVQDMTGSTVRPTLIFNGIDMPQTVPRGESPPRDLVFLGQRPFMLILTRLRYFKGVGLCIEAVRRLKESGHHVPPLVIAGDGPQDKALRAQVAVGRLQDQVRFVGVVRGYEKAWLLANCLFFVQSSREGEGMPNAVLEAMSYGRPVLGTAAPGIRDVVTPGVNGLLAQPDDPQALAEGMIQMLKADLDQLGTGARQWAQAHSWEQCAQKYLALFENVCGSFIF